MNIKILKFDKNLEHKIKLINDYSLNDFSFEKLEKNGNGV